MKALDLRIGLEVVRIDGDNHIGTVGTIIEIDGDVARVKWEGRPRTWVNAKSFEPTSIPYEIVRVSRRDPRMGTRKLYRRKFREN
jgi:hypothetical protein